MYFSFDILNTIYIFAEEINHKKYKIMEKFVNISDEQKIETLLAYYVSKERLAEFIQKHRSDIQAIASGRPTSVLELNKKETGEIYKCRIHGIKEITNGNAIFYSFNQIFPNKELRINPEIKIGQSKAVLTDKQIEGLKKYGRLNESIQFTDNSGKTVNRYIAVDKELNRLAFANDTIFRVPSQLLNTPLSSEQQLDLKSGKKVEFIRMKDGVEQKPCNIFYDPIMQTVRFEQKLVPNTNKEQTVGQIKQQGQSNDKIQSPWKKEALTKTKTASPSISKKEPKQNL